jgi:hypothetical protein
VNVPIFVPIRYAFRSVSSADYCYRN